jgi:TldD protein
MANKPIETLQERIADTLKLGADYADIYIQAGTGHSAHYEDGRIEELSSSNTDGSGARIIIGDKTYYSHAPGISCRSIEETISQTTDSALGIKMPVSDGSAESILASETHIVPPNIDFLHQLDLYIRKQSSYIRQAAFRYSVSKRKILIIKSNGSYAEDERNYCSFTVQVIAEKNGILQTGYERRCMAVPDSSFWDGTTPENIAQAALERALLMLDAKPCPAGKMNILLDGEAGGTIIHEACGHGLEADIVDKDYSVYRGKIGKKVADSSITMIDDPTLPCLYGSYHFDDEGTPARRNVLIENGILKSYMTDILSAKTGRLPLTGNGRRESYRNIPVPRMSNTFVLPGSADFESMLAQAGNGLLVKKMGGGEVNPTTGDFVFYVSEAYVIKNGAIDYPVRGAILTGNGPEALQNIIALGHNLIMDPGVCGKSGQGVPVTDGQPSMLIKNLTVGGSEA